VAVSLGLIGEDPASQVAIVVSHDCDIAEDDLANEPSLEVIAGRFIDEADPNHTYAKSPSKLHIPITVDGRLAILELRSSKKRVVEKTALAADKPDPRIALGPKMREVLQQWLALRYRRATFPDALNSHLSDLRDTLQKIGKKNPQAVIGFFIYFEPDSEIADPNEPYELWVVVVYDHLIAGASEIAEGAAEKISKRLSGKFKHSSGWRNVELRECTSRSDVEFSLYDATTYQNFPLEYISLRANDTAD
jgi:hypothetical protein